MYGWMNKVNISRMHGSANCSNWWLCKYRTESLLTAAHWCYSQVCNRTAVFLVTNNKSKPKNKQAWAKYDLFGRGKKIISKTVSMTLHICVISQVKWTCLSIYAIEICCSAMWYQNSIGKLLSHLTLLSFWIAWEWLIWLVSTWQLLNN